MFTFVCTATENIDEVPCPVRPASPAPNMRRISQPDTAIIPALLADISPGIVECLDIEDLVRARATNTVWDQCVAAVLHQRVLRLFRDHINDYDSFVQMMEETGAVIGGLGAIHVLFPHHAAPPFLELFTPQYSHEDLLCHLVYKENFKRPIHIPVLELTDLPTAPSVDHTGTEHPSVPADLAARLAHDRRAQRGVSEVVFLTKGTFGMFVIQSTVDSPLYPITAEANSALFSYIGPRLFSCAYPALVRQSRALLNPLLIDENDGVTAVVQAVADSWVHQGWTFSAEWQRWSPTTICTGPRTAGCAVATRFFGDRFCVSGALWPVRTPEDGDWWYGEEMETVMWWRGGRTCARTCHRGVKRLEPGARVCHKATVAGL